NTEAATRNPAFVSRSVAWTTRLVGDPHGKTLLDLGCGPGIYTELFTDHGFSVTGIDFSPRSVDYARKSAVDQGKSIEYRCQNYLDLDREGEFDVITMIYCDFGVLGPMARGLLLKKIRRALKPGGFFLFDVWSRVWGETFREGTEATYENGGFWKAEPYLCITRHCRYDPAPTFLDQYVIITKANADCYNIWETAFNPAALGEELRVAGFSCIDFYDDVAGTDYSGNAETLCAIAR
ncbi:MAG: class I SAM-dependent methyltransferase, partial [bacterium]